MRNATPVLAATLAVLALAGCDKLKGMAGGGGSGPVAATVNGEKITVAQVDAELKASGDEAAAKDPALRQVAVQRIIARKVLADEARKEKLDATPEAKILKNAAAETFEATLVQRDALAKVKPPTDAEVQAFIQQNPAMFANRMLYVLEEAQLEKAPDAATQAALKPVDAYDGVLKVLAEHGINVRRGTAQLDTLQIDPRLTDALAKLPPGNAIVLPAPPTVAVARVLGSKPQPLTGPQAEAIARQVMVNQRRQKAVNDRMQGLIKAAEAHTTYGAGYAPPKPGT
jgi:peptidyl-prolyl cis-trans isomerase C